MENGSSGEFGGFEKKACAYLSIEDKSIPEHWDKLAKPFSSFERVTGYAEEFLHRAGIMPGESVLDVGCGSGTLAIPLSDRGNHVTGLDFSPKMLESVRDVIAAEGIGNIDLIEGSWDDDWGKLGVPVCDVAIASRSMMWGDIVKGVEKLDSHARRRVCVTIQASASMFHLRSLELHLGRQPGPQLEDLGKVLSTCIGMDRQPEVSYIRSLRYDVYSSPDKVRGHLLAKIGGLRDGEEASFEDYCSRYVKPHLDDRGERDGWFCDKDAGSSWAFVSWDKDPEAALEAASGSRNGDGGTGAGRDAANENLRVEIKYHK